MTLTQAKNIKQYFSRALIVCSFLWIGYLAYLDRAYLDDICGRLLIPANFFWIIVSLFVGCLSNFLPVLIFREILNHDARKNFSLREILRFFFVSQIVRYLPGRLLGIAYQVAKADVAIPAAVIVRSNLEFIILSFLFSALFGVVVLSFYMASPLVAMLIAAAGFLIIYFYLKFNWASWLLSSLSKVIPSKRLKAAAPLWSRWHFSVKSIGNIFLFFSVSWGLYVLAWWSLGRVFQEQDMVILCVTYTAAYMVGILSMITPGGVGVRESVFVYISSGVADASTLAVISIFMWCWFVLIDFILAGVVMLLERSRKQPISHG